MANPAPGKEEEKKKVTQTSAHKRQIQNEKRRVQNKAVRSRLKTTVKDLLEAVKTKDTSSKQNLIQEVYSQVDKAAKKGIYSRNKANRLKSQLGTRVHSSGK
jgi:small subunit ribosomal protein S20